MLPKRNVHSQAQLWREIDRVCAEWDIVIGDENAATQFGKWDSAPSIPPEVVFDIEWSEAYCVGVLDGLTHKIDWDCLELVLK